MSTHIYVRELRRHAEAADEWNTAARRSGAGYVGEWHQARAWAYKRFPRMRLRMFEIFTDSPGPGARRSQCRVGQCAVAVSRDGGTFLDRLQLEPGHESSWSEAMRAVLSNLGPGRYEYGWPESLEPPREGELGQMAGVAVTQVRPLTVHSIEFSAWPTWDAYFRAVSTNVRRNVKKAQTGFPDLTVEWRSGISGISQVRSLIRLRSQTYGRKGLGFGAPAAVLSTVANLASAGPASFTAVARGGGRELAAVSGIRFGANTYYRDGGSVADNGGAAWHLLMAVIERAFCEHGQGRLVMGYLDPRIHDESVSGGLLRQRRSCRVIEVPTSTVTFTWAG